LKSDMVGWTVVFWLDDLVWIVSLPVHTSCIAVRLMQWCCSTPVLTVVSSKVSWCFHCEDCT
jgi:hypothetical protein